jgi:hypothetical protein
MISKERSLPGKDVTLKSDRVAGAYQLLRGRSKFGRAAGNKETIAQLQVELRRREFTRAIDRENRLPNARNPLVATATKTAPSYLP